MVEDKKYKNLIQYLKELKSAVVAFSGGVDSTFLIKVAKEALNDKVIAVTIVSPYTPDWEAEEANELVHKLGLKHEIIHMPVLDSIKFNPKDRCYICKKNIFTKINEFAKKNGYEYVLDGTNFDDTKDYRPGIRALKELGVKSPLLENELTKDEIRKFSKSLGLKTWNKPAYACLLSRVPYDTEIKINELQRIEKAEVYLMNLGFKGVRVRSHNDLARIEVAREHREKLFNAKLLDEISIKLKEFGFKYVTLDLYGYRVGSFNETLTDI